MESIFDLHKKLKGKKVSAKELTLDSLKKAKETKTNAYISLLEDIAIKNAQIRDEKMKRDGPCSYLDGIPYVLKDLFVTQDIRTTAASKMLLNYIPPYEGHAHGVLKESGAILIGKASCDEFGMGSSNERSAFGPVLHPQNMKRVAGGSSGGTAAIVSEGHVPFGLGTDTGGSSRVPASFCGIVGFKPSYSRVSRYGQIAYASSFDQTSPMGRDVLDIAIVMEYLSRHDIRDPLNINRPLNVVNELLALKDDSEKRKAYLKTKTIGLPLKFLSGPSDVLKKNLEKALKAFEELGVQVREIVLPHVDYSVPAYYLLAVSEAFANLSRFDGIRYGLRQEHKGKIEDTYKDSRTFSLGEEVKRRILLGAHTLSKEHYEDYFLKASKIRRLIYNDFEEAFQNCDAIFSPVSALGVPLLGAIEASPEKMYFNDLYTVLANMAGLPAIALPFGVDENHLPTGFQLLGRRLLDEELLKLSFAFESSLKER